MAESGDGGKASRPVRIRPADPGKPQDLLRSSIQDALRKLRRCFGCTDGTPPLLRREGAVRRAEEMVRAPQGGDLVLGRTVTHGGSRRAEQECRFSDGSSSYVPGGK